MAKEKQNRTQTWATVFLVISIVIGVAMVPQLNKYGNRGLRVKVKFAISMSAPIKQKCECLKYLSAKDVTLL